MAGLLKPPARFSQGRRKHPDDPVSVAGLLGSFAPVVGDAVGFASDIRDMHKANELSPKNVGLAGAGLLPFVPAGIWKHMKAPLGGKGIDNSGEVDYLASPITKEEWHEMLELADEQAREVGSDLRSPTRWLQNPQTGELFIGPQANMIHKDLADAEGLRYSLEGLRHGYGRGPDKMWWQDELKFGRIPKIRKPLDAIEEADAEHALHQMLKDEWGD